MIDRPALRELGKTAEKWRALAEKRRDYFSELYRSGRWRLFYDEYGFRARVRDVAEICDRWAAVVEQNRQGLSAPEAPPIDRDAA